MMRRREALGIGLAATASWLARGPAFAADPNESGAESSPVPNLWTRRQGNDWPSFLGPRGDSKSDETGILTNWPAAGPRMVWQKQVRTGYAMPSVCRGRLFHFDRLRDQARLTCMQAETGQELWQFDYSTQYEDLYNYNNGPRCSPVIDDDRVYIFGVEGMLHCLSVVDGREIWKIDTAARFGVIQNFFGVGSTPAIEGRLLIAQIGGSPPEAAKVPSGRLDRVKGNGSGVVAFDKFTGEIAYKLSDELASYASLVLATIAGRRWCLAFTRGGLLAFEPATGVQDFFYPWRARDLESVNASNPVVVDDRVFLSETYGPGSSLLRLKPGGYDAIWTDREKGREKSMQTHWNTAIHHAGYLYGSSGRHLENAELRCIELQTGKVQWSVPDLTRSSLLYVDGHLVCLTEIGRLLLVKATPKEYSVVADVVLQLPPPGVGTLLKEPAWAPPILSHGLMYVKGRDRLACLELIPEKA